MSPDDADTNPIEDEILVPAIDATSNIEDEIKLKHACGHADARVVEDSGHFQEKAGSVSTLEELLE